MINAVLKVIGGKQDGKLIPLTTKKFLIGREQDCHLRPNSDSVSRHHCVISLDDFSVQLRDLGSSNGTFLNGIRVLGVQQAKSGDRLKIGTLEFEIVCNSKVAMGAAAVKSTGTSFSLDEFGLEELPEANDTAVVASGSDDTVVVNPQFDEEVPAESPTAVTDELNSDEFTTSSEEVAAPIPAVDPNLGQAPLSDAAAMAMPQGMPQMMPPGMNYPGYGQQPQPFPGYGMPMPGMQMPQPGYPYGMPQQPFPGYGMQMPQPGYMPQMPQMYGMPGAMPFGQPGYPQPQPMGYGAYPQAAPQPLPQAEPAPVEAPAAVADLMPVNLPPPEETGFKAVPVDPNKPKDAPKVAAPNPAAEALKKYMTRR